MLKIELYKQYKQFVKSIEIDFLRSISKIDGYQDPQCNLENALKSMEIARLNVASKIDENRYSQCDYQVSRPNEEATSETL